MKKFLIWFALIVVVALLIYLVDAGKNRWQPLTVAVAVLLGPLRFIAGLFGSGEEKIRDRHRRTREEEAAFQAAVETEVQRREQRVQELQTETTGLDQELDRLANERAAVEAEIRGESASQLLDRLGRIQG